MDLNECAELLKKYKAEETKNNEGEAIKSFLKSGLIKGVASKNAQVIVDTFCKDTLNALTIDNKSL